MSGYHGYSMSNNAYNAYQASEKPYSRWTKSELVEAVLSVNSSVDPTLLKKVRLEILRKNLLYYTGWHHTGTYFNQTDFYGLDTDAMESLTDADLKELIAIKKEKKEAIQYRAKCSFLIWSGTKRRPHATRTVESGIIKGNWFYRWDGSKKSIQANGFEILEKEPMERDEKDGR